MGAPAEEFLDQLVTWRELGHAFCVHREDYERYESLPEWARATLEACLAILDSARGPRSNERPRHRQNGNP